MRRGLFIFCILILSLGCAQKKELLLDSFEGPLTKETVDYGSSEGSSVVVSAESNLKVCGAQSLRLDYELKPQGYMWIARGYKLDVEGAAKWLLPPSQIIWGKYNAFSVYVYGRNSGGVIAFDIKDSRQEMWRFIIDDDFSGWREIICPFDAFFARKDWQPASATVNDVLDFPIMSFQFEPRTPSKGTYYFDCVKLVEKKNVK